MRKIMIKMPTPSERYDRSIMILFDDDNDDDDDVDEYEDLHKIISFILRFRMGCFRWRFCLRMVGQVWTDP